jgi:hypothetical protein
VTATRKVFRGTFLPGTASRFFPSFLIIKPSPKTPLSSSRM